jgi:hypothetical protein
MSASLDTATAPAPTIRRLIRTTGIALVVALVLLVTVVLPAEYAIDPIGTGRWLGLTEIAAPTMTAVDQPRAAGAPLMPVVTGPVAAYPTEFKLDVFEVTLQPYEYVEYKYHLEQGAAMQYAWTAAVPLLQDFHGERVGQGPNSGPAEESFDKEDRRQATGVFTAPFTGLHGWYWENPTQAPVTVRLTTSGFYGSAVEIRSDRTRHSRTLRSLDTLAASAPGTNTPMSR